jgi:hypothetical protein
MAESQLSYFHQYLIHVRLAGFVTYIKRPFPHRKHSRRKTGNDDLFVTQLTETIGTTSETSPQSGDVSAVRIISTRPIFTLPRPSISFSVSHCSFFYLLVAGQARLAGLTVGKRPGGKMEDSGRGKADDFAFHLMRQENGKGSPIEYQDSITCT